MLVYDLAPQAGHPPLGQGVGSIKPEHVGLAGLTGADLALASLLLLSSAMQQPIYVFENGKFLQSYGKGLGGTPITIGYDSKNQQYFGFTNKGSSNSGSIFEAISASSNGKYSADILRGVVQPIPVADTTPPKPPSQLTPQPKPLSQSELSAAQFLVDTLTADKQQLQAKENEYHRNILQIAKQNMHDSAAKQLARDEALMQQAYAIGGDIGHDYAPKIVDPRWQVKTMGDTAAPLSIPLDIPPQRSDERSVEEIAGMFDLTGTFNSNAIQIVSPNWRPVSLNDVRNHFYKEVVNPEATYQYRGGVGNFLVASTAVAGELVKYGTQNIMHPVSRIEWLP